MAQGDIKGKARVDPRNPRAFGVCDAGGEWRPRHELLKQMEYYGSDLQWTGFLVCKEHYDKPQQQLRPIILPPDPIPVELPRVEPFTLDSGLQGLSQYVLYLPPFAQQTMSAVLQAGAVAAGFPYPGGYSSYSATILQPNVSQALVPNDPDRTFLFLYNVDNPQMQVSWTGPAMWGVRTNFILGPGEALIGVSPGGLSILSPALYAISLQQGTNIFVWEGDLAYTIYPFNGPGPLTISSAQFLSFPGIYSIALTTPAALPVYLPPYSGITGPWKIKDTNGIAQTYNISVYPATGTNIENLAVNQPYVISSNFQEVEFNWDPYRNIYIVS